MDNKKQLIEEYSNMIMKIEYEFLQNKLFQPIGIELTTIPVILDTEETFLFKNMSSGCPPAYFDPRNKNIHIFIEHNSFIKRKTSEERYMFLMFLLFHEAGHKLFLTSSRLNNRDPELWNIATDLEIHNMYYVYSELVKNSHFSDFKKYCSYIDNFLILKKNLDDDLNEGLFEKEFLNNIAEEIYQILLNSKKEETQTYTFDSSNVDNSSSENSNQNSNKNSEVKVTVSTYTLPSGKELKTTTIEFPNFNDETTENEENERAVRKTLLENTIKEEIENQKHKGNISSECLNFLNKKFHVKIDWKKILRNSLLSSLEKSDFFSWSKPRTSLYGMPNAPYLPSQCEDNEKYGTLVIARDESGSMSNEEVAKAANIIIEAKAHYKKIVIIKHDTEIKSVTEVEELDDKAQEILYLREANGGTSHKDVFQWLHNYYVKGLSSDEQISCFIAITDLESDIETYQDMIPQQIPKIYLAPTNSIEYHENIKGIVIPVEL